MKVRALDLGLAVHQPSRLDAAARDSLRGRFDLLVSFAYGRIFGPLFLKLFPAGGLNVHPSLLPRWRGPSPLTAAILARDPETGISVQRLALRMDTGDVLVRSVRTLDGSETTGSLTAWAAEAAAPLLVEAITRTADARVGQVQDESAATYCALTAKDDGRIDWGRSAADVEARIRAYDPWPRAFTDWNGQRLALRCSSVFGKPGAGAPPGTVVSIDKSDGILVQTGDGLVAVRELQLPARKAMDFRSFLNGNPGLVGARLGEPS